MVAKKPLAVIFATWVLAVLLCGCAERDPDSPGEKSREPGIIHYMTGAEQLKRYRKTKSKIEDIDRARKKQYQSE